jgi:hypothetical protein
VTQPTLSETAENVFARFMASTMADQDVLDPSPPLPARRRSSVYSGVVRAHPECDSDPELPHYSSSPTASRPELIIIEDEDMPPPLTPLRSGTPVSTGSSDSSTGDSTTGLVPEPAPGYTTRPATPLLIREAPVDPPEQERQMVSIAQPVIPFAPYASSAPAPVPHVTFARGIGLSREDMPARPPTARRKHNQRRGRRVAEIAFIAAI